MGVLGRMFDIGNPDGISVEVDWKLIGRITVCKANFTIIEIGRRLSKIVCLKLVGLSFARI